jgi:hypothetical protein
MKLSPITTNEVSKLVDEHFDGRTVIGKESAKALVLRAVIFEQQRHVVALEAEIATSRPKEKKKQPSRRC